MQKTNGCSNPVPIASENTRFRKGVNSSFSAPLVRMEGIKMNLYKISLIGRFFNPSLLSPRCHRCKRTLSVAARSRGPTPKTLSIYAEEYLDRRNELSISEAHTDMGEWGKPRACTGVEAGKGAADIKNSNKERWVARPNGSIASIHKFRCRLVETLVATGSSTDP